MNCKVKKRTHVLLWHVLVQTVVLLQLSCLFSGCPEPPIITCETFDDCKEGEDCVDGFCAIPKKLDITTETIPPGKVDAQYSIILQAEGGVGDKTWSFASDVPDWLDIEASTGKLYGLPQQEDQEGKDISIRVNDQKIDHDEETFNLRVRICVPDEQVSCHIAQGMACYVGFQTCDVNEQLGDCEPEEPSQDTHYCGENCATCDQQQAPDCVSGICKCGIQAEAVPCQGEDACMEGGCIGPCAPERICPANGWNCGARDTQSECGTVDCGVCDQGYCADNQCQCEELEQNCGDGIDGDCDSTTDCADDDCTEKVCKQESCTDLGSCSGYESICDESGTRSRKCTNYSCTGGNCIGTESDKSEDCFRETDEQICNSTACGPWGNCNYSSGCDESATRSRTCNDFTCSDGNCIGKERDESESCTRETDGDPCGDVGVCNNGSCICSGSCLPGGTCNNGNCTCAASCPPGGKCCHFPGNNDFEEQYYCCDSVSKRCCPEVPMCMAGMLCPV